MVVLISTLPSLTLPTLFPYSSCLFYLYRCHHLFSCNILYSLSLLPPSLHIPQGNMTDPHNPYHHILPTHRIFISVIESLLHIMPNCSPLPYPTPISRPILTPHLTPLSLSSSISHPYNMSPYLNIISHSTPMSRPTPPLPDITG